MIIAKRLRTLREAKGMSQGDIENKTGMLRCYISRVENGHTVPSLETVERFAAALEVPVHELFYDEQEDPKAPHLTPRIDAQQLAQEQTLPPQDRTFLRKLQNLLGSLRERDRQLLLALAGRMAAGQS